MHSFHVWEHPSLRTLACALLLLTAVVPTVCMAWQETGESGMLIPSSPSLSGSLVASADPAGKPGTVVPVSWQPVKSLIPKNMTPGGVFGGRQYYPEASYAGGVPSAGSGLSYSQYVAASGLIQNFGYSASYTSGST